MPKLLKQINVNTANAKANYITVNIAKANY